MKGLGLMVVESEFGFKSGSKDQYMGQKKVR